MSAPQVSEYFAARGDTRGLARAALRRMEHFYYKTDAVYGAMRKLAVQQQQAANLLQARGEPSLNPCYELWQSK